jgi:thioredoxin-related protein
VFVDFLSKALKRLPAVTNSDSEKNPPRAQNNNGNPPGEVKATSTDPARAEREEKNVHGVVWGMSFDQARELAAADVRPVLIEFTGVNCPNCRLMDRRVLPRPEVVALLKKFVTVQLYTDFVPISSLTSAQRERLAHENQERQLTLAQATTIPLYAVLSPTGDLLARLDGAHEPPAFVEFLNKAIERNSPLK